MAADDPAIVESPLTESNLLLYADALDHMTDFLGGSSSDVSQRVVRRAIVNAYNRLTNETDWKYLYKHGRVHLVPPYSTGTIAFTFSTLQVTLTDGTWPTWAKYGRIKINEIVYDVDQRSSTTVLTLKQPECPDADIASGTSYILYRNCYPLYTNFRRICAPSGEKIRTSQYISPEEFVWLERQRRQAGYPYRWTVMANPDRNGEYAIWVYGYPTVTPSETLDFLYQKSARHIRRSGYETADYTGTISVSASATAVTGSTTAFAADIAGSYMRFSATSAPPDGDGGTNPFVEQRKIRSVGGTTALTLDAGPDNTYSAQGYRISDPIDLPQYLHGAFFRCIEWQYAILSRMSDADRYYGAYQRELIRARESDSIIDVPRSLGGGIGFSDTGGWRSPLSGQVS